MELIEILRQEILLACPTYVSVYWFFLLKEFIKGRDVESTSILLAEADRCLALTPKQRYFWTKSSMSKIIYSFKIAVLDLVLLLLFFINCKEELTEVVLMNLSLVLNLFDRHVGDKYIDASEQVN